MKDDAIIFIAWIMIGIAVAYLGTISRFLPATIMGSILILVSGLALWDIYRDREI